MDLHVTRADEQRPWWRCVVVPTVIVFAFATLAQVVSTTGAVRSATRSGPDLVAEIPTEHRASLFDPRGNVIVAIDADGNTTTYGYDAKGNLTKTHYADGAEITTTVDSHGNPITSVGPDAGIWRSSFDAFGNLTGTTNPLGATSATQYDASGRPVVFIDPTGARSSQVYDALGRVTSRVDATGRTTSYAYDRNDQVISVTDSAGVATTTRYDVRGKVASRTDALGNTTTYSYDAVGNLASETDPAGHRTTYGYDNLDRLVTVTDAIGGVTRYDYDAAGQMTRLTDANGHSIAHTYWPTGRLKSNDYADGSQMSFGYDPNGNLTRRSKRDGTQVSHTYDNRNRLRITTLGSGRRFFSDYNASGLLTSVRDTETGEITYGHDLAQRVTSTTKANGAVIDYGFDPAGRVSSLTVGSQSQSWSYDAAGRTATATDFSSQTSTLGYDAAGRFATLARPGAAGSTGISYDPAGRVTRVNSGPSLGDFEYAVDSVGNRTAMTETLAGYNDVVDYQYDSLNRLTKEARRSGSVNEFSYDAVGNRTRATGEPNRAYDVLDQVVGWDYDQDGNLLADDDKTYSYDGLDRLTSVTRPADGYSASFTWDPEGNLARQTQGGVARDLTVDSASGLARVLVEADPENPGVPTASYSYGAANSAQLLSLTNEGGHRWAHADALGSIRTLGDDDGNATDARTYSAYGMPGPFNTGTNTEPFGFTGQLTDGSGLQWLRTRWYAPEQGRFLSRDQFGLAIDRIGTQQPTDLESVSPRVLNPYSYANSSPATPTDPSGEFGLLDKGAEDAAEKELRTKESGVARYVLRWIKDKLGSVKTKLGQARSPQLTSSQRQAVDKVIRNPEDMKHLFDAKHNLGEVVKQVGGQEAFVERVIGVLGTVTTAGPFEVVVTIAATPVVVRGIVVEGIVRLGTFFAL